MILVGAKIHPDALRALREVDVAPVRIWTEDRPMDRAVLREWLRPARAFLATLNDRVDAAVLEGAPHLQVVANLAVGYDNLDLDALTARGVLATNTPDVLTEATAELTWALILAVSRGLIAARQALLDGHWTHWRADGFLGTELGGRVLGLVGAGRIGRAVAQRAPAFGMEAVFLDPGPGHRPPTDWPCLAPPKFFASADIVSLHLPLTGATRHLVDDRWLRQMKPGALLINTSRGALVDETALWEALERGDLAGVGLDVFEEEPVDPRSRLVRHPRVVATPHIGSATHDTRRRMALRAATNLIAALRGEAPPDLLNPAAWERRGH